VNKVFKLISILLAAIPVFLFLRGVVGRSSTMKRAVSDFRRQIDCLVWVMLFVIAVKAGSAAPEMLAEKSFA
jgi:ABC-type phosphate/phosphonate transport system permease subunit